MKINPSLLFLTLAITVYGGDTTPTAPLSGKPFESTGHKDFVLLGAGIAFSAAAFAIEHTIEPLTQEEVNGLSRNSVNRFDRNATYHYSKSLGSISDVLVDLTLAAPLCLFTDRKIRETVKTFSIMYAEVVMFAYALPSLGKGLVERPRPFVYNPAAAAEEKLSRDARVSFFSRHTTFAFASACFMSTVYGGYHPGSKLNPYVWAGSLGAASVVGYLRFAAGAHFPTDILTGALAGTLIGCGVPYLQRAGRAPAAVSLQTAGSGLYLTIRWGGRHPFPVHCYD